MVSATVLPLGTLVLFSLASFAWFAFGLIPLWNVLLTNLDLAALVGTHARLVSQHANLNVSPPAEAAAPLGLKFAAHAALLHVLLFVIGAGVCQATASMLGKLLPNKTNKHVAGLAWMGVVGAATFHACKVALLHCFNERIRPVHDYGSHFFDDDGGTMFADLGALSLLLAAILGYVFQEASTNSSAVVSRGAAWLCASLFKSFVVSFLVVRTALYPAWKEVVAPSSGPFDQAFFIAAAFTHSAALVSGIAIMSLTQRLLSKCSNVLGGAAYIPRMFGVAIVGLLALAWLSLLFLLFFGWVTFAADATVQVFDVALDALVVPRHIVFVATTYGAFFFLGILLLESQTKLSSTGAFLVCTAATLLVMVLTMQQGEADTTPDTTQPFQTLSQILAQSRAALASSSDSSAHGSILAEFHVDAVSLFLGIGMALFAVGTWLMATPSASHAQHPAEFHHNDRRFQRLRRKTFPPPYPNSWYNLIRSRMIPKGKVQSLSCLGRHFVIFRGSNGKVTVMDAFCPHIGAHLGEGGKVVQNSIECPFHGWRFDQDGECVHIPYKQATIPKQQARIHTYETVEHLGCIWIWFDAEGRPPAYEMIRWEGVDTEDGWYQYGPPSTSIFDQHCAEMFENSGDYYHFQTLHAPLPYPSFLSSFLSLVYDVELRLDDEQEHICYFDNWSQVLFLGKFRMPFSRYLTKATFDGPCRMLFSIQSPWGEIRAVKTVLPLEPFRTYSEDIFYAETSVPRWFMFFIKKTAEHALEQDRQVWENKIYLERPTFVKGDEPFRRHRKWYAQFFSESSRKVAEDNYNW